MQFLLLLLVLLFFLSALSMPTAGKSLNRYSFIFDQMTISYTNAIKTYRKKAETNLDHLKTFIATYITKNNSTNQSKETETPVFLQVDGLEEIQRVNNEYEMGEDDFEDFTESGKGRFLIIASDCKNGGVLATAKVIRYRCNDRAATKDQYNQVNGENCTITERTENVCYCPVEYYGDTCGTLLSFKCDLERVNYPVDCQGVDGFNYIYSYHGVPPCYTVQNGETIIMTNRLTCRFENASLAYEGAKPTGFEVSQQPTISGPVFNYAVDTVNFKLTKLPQNIRQRLVFVNWKRLTRPYVIETPLSAANLDGSQTIDTQITFDSDLSSLAHIGRYYYELTVMRNISSNASTELTGNYYGGYFEQAGYVEPPPPKKSSNVLLIALLVLGAVIVIGVFVGYKIYQRKQNSSNIVFPTEAQPLVESS